MKFLEAIFFEKTQQNADFLKSQRPYTPGGYTARGGSLPSFGDDIAPMTTLGVGRHQTVCWFSSGTSILGNSFVKTLEFQTCGEKRQRKPRIFSAGSRFSRSLTKESPPKRLPAENNGHFPMVFSTEP